MAGQLIKDLKISAIRGALELSAAMAALGLFPSLRGSGVIFTLHRVRPLGSDAFAPNRHLEISPDFLEKAILTLKAAGYRFMSADRVRKELQTPSSSQPFAVFTLDDGFRDNVDHALPVFDRHGVPFTIFACRGFSERSHTMWWETAAAMIAEGRTLAIETEQGPMRLDCQTLADKHKAFARIATTFAAGDEALAIERLNAAAYAVGVDPYAIVAENIMDGGELRKAAAHPLLTLGAHTVSHRGLARLSDDEILDELNQSADYVASLTGKRPRVFAYPYGDQRSATDRTAAYAQWAGFELSVTTRPGTLSDASLEKAHLLPRISLNGHYQAARYVTALASGIPSRISGR